MRTRNAPSLGFRRALVGLGGIALVLEALTAFGVERGLIGLGPLLGACWFGFRSERRSVQPMIGGILGGAVEVIAIAIAIALLVDPESPNHPYRHPLQSLFLFGESLIFCMTLGAFIGLLVSAGFFLTRTEPVGVDPWDEARHDGEFDAEVDERRREVVGASF
jgi:hypothetical protein